MCSAGRVQTWLDTYPRFRGDRLAPAKAGGRSMRDPILVCRPIADARIGDNHSLFLAAPDCYRKRSFSKQTKNGLQAECLQPSVRKREISQAHRQPGGCLRYILATWRGSSDGLQCPSSSQPADKANTNPAQ